MSVRRRPRRRLVAVLLVAAVAAFGWFAGLMRFAAELPHAVGDPDRYTDGIVVLTGGTARIDSGLVLLGAGKAKRMFISGVNPATSKSIMRQMAGTGGELLDCCVDLGFDAADTRGNALEIATWAAEGDYRSLRVVTASYHMPRSLVELRHSMPAVDLVPHPVFPQQFKQDDWWAWPGTASLLVEEYNKYLAALVRVRLEDVAGALGGSLAGPADADP